MYEQSSRKFQHVIFEIIASKVSHILSNMKVTSSYHEYSFIYWIDNVNYYTEGLLIFSSVKVGSLEIFSFYKRPP